MVALSKSKKTALGRVVAWFSSGTRCGDPPVAATPSVVFEVPKSRPQAAMRRLALQEGGISIDRKAIRACSLIRRAGRHDENLGVLGQCRSRQHDARPFVAADRIAAIAIGDEGLEAAA